MMAYVERDKAIAYVEEQYRLFKDDEDKQAIVEGCVEALKFTPTADVVEVVRCKECKHKTHSNKRIMCKKDAIKTAMGFYYGLIATEPNNFCSCGERRTDDDL